MSDLDFMKIALEEAQQAETENEVPVGAVLVLDGRILAQDHNRMVQRGSALAHAEMLTLQGALESSRAKWLVNSTLFVTLEPCAMCAGALVIARVKRLVFATPDPKAGACGTTMNLVRTAHLNHRVEVESGLLKEESSSLLSRFFQKIREQERR